MLRHSIILAAVVIVGGCVERTVTINSAPKGALVYLNDKEIGRTPVTVPFEWYGDYDVVLRKDGCETVKTHRKLPQPWYEVPGIDIFSELLFPGTIHDDHVWDFDLPQAEPTDAKALMDRAAQAHNAAQSELSASPTATQPAGQGTIQP